jgi:hypothetical protein
MNAVCPKLYYPKAFKHLKLAGLLACSILDAFPFRLGTVALEISRTLSELTAAVSAQDFHLIPFSLITSRIEEMSTKIEGKYTEDYLINKYYRRFFYDIS